MNKFGIEDIRQTFRGKNIFITGHTGFKGSWLSYILDYAGATVTGFSLPPSSKKNHFNYLELDKKIINIIGDIRNFQLLNKSISEAKPDFIFHLAAQALVRKSYKDTLETYQTNVIGSTNLLESVRLSDTVRSLIFITSDKWL
jgi:CDP-glucose 4,6-dehydratase